MRLAFFLLWALSLLLEGSAFFRTFDSRLPAFRGFLFADLIRSIALFSIALSARPSPWDAYALLWLATDTLIVCALLLAGIEAFGRVMRRHLTAAAYMVIVCAELGAAVVTGLAMPAAGALWWLLWSRAAVDFSVAVALAWAMTRERAMRHAVALALLCACDLAAILARIEHPDGYLVPLFAVASAAAVFCSWVLPVAKR